MTSDLFASTDRSIDPPIDRRSGGSDAIDGRLVEDALRVLVDLRSLIASSRTIDDAWRAGLGRVARLANCRRAVVWEQTDAGVADVRHAWAADGRATAADAMPETIGPAGETTSAVGRAWTSGQTRPGPASDVWRRCEVGEVGEVGEVDDDTATARALFVPVTSTSSTIAVLELVMSVDALADDVVELVVAVVGELGETIEHKRLQHDLIVAEEQFRLTFEAAAVGIGLAAPDGTFLRANDSFCRFVGRTEDELRHIGFRQITHPDDVERDHRHLREMLDGTRDRYQAEKRYVHVDGRAIWALLSSALVRDEDGAPMHFVFQVHDIDARKTAERRMEHATATFRAAFDDSAIGMALVRLDGATAGLMTETNDAFAEITGRSHETLTTRLLADIVDGADTDRLDDLLRDLATTEDSSARRDELRLRRTGDEPGWIRLVAAPVCDPVAGERLAVVQIEDITDRRQAQERLAHNALHDPLTGLPNRILITDRIRMAQHRSARNHHHVGILFIDLDRFKDINDSHGHDTGDRLLEEIAERFRHLLRPSDTAARIGGDEFVILCDDLDEDLDTATGELEQIADRLHRTLTVPVTIDAVEVFVTASIGMNVVRGADAEVRTTLGNADAAMYRAKSRGRSRSEPYDATIRSEAVDRLRLGTELRHAIERDELTVAYQPIVEVDSGIVRGAEALLRWHHPDLGDVAPVEFISVAEDTDLIVHLGEFVIEQVCGHLRTAHHDDDFYVSANVSARQLSRSDFFTTVTRNLEEHEIEPAKLAVELTENVLMDAAGSSLAQLDDLRDLGVRVGVDDFGTGYASLTYLKQLPVSFVKVDRSFTDGLATDASDRSITDAVIGLARSLELDVIAEGVETAEQARILSEMGCAHAQGYHYGRPQPA